MSVGRQIEIRGVVQGVGFRPWVYNLARIVGLTGSVSNDSAGVVIQAFANVETALDDFLSRIRSEHPPAARIEALSWSALEAPAPASFEIIETARHGERRPSIPADLATCAECAREIANPSDRRYRYAFTSCTHCGPRFTIALEVPYDRATTTMAPFPMCGDCQREYEDPRDRRFHAQPNACPRCGPALRLVDLLGRTVAQDGTDAIAHAAALLVRGAIVAIKGLGGFHLACDATREDGVLELRRRKHRDEKPFAVMVRDLTSAEKLGMLRDPERALLDSAARPIVIVRRRRESVIARAVAPDSERVGLMLPYTPLHHVLLGDVGRPLVMTSGNASDEPIACDDEDALRRLASIADAFLLHDRVIASRADDSVAFVALDRPVITRRSRGYVPDRITLQRPLARATLACGAHMKNAFCIGSGDGAYFGPHIGDLDNVAAYEGYERAITRMEAFLHVRPEVIAHDMHPDYLSTRYAVDRAAADEATTCIAVQHHHAHVVSALVEHGLSGPVLGVAFDGTGYGTDGTSWGGELLIADASGFERVASFRRLRLAGGDRAVKQVWRAALALLDDAYDDAPLHRLSLFDDVPEGEIRVVRRMIARQLNAPLSSGVGRYFDAFGALALARAHARFEGQIAIACEQVADPTETRAYPFALDPSQPMSCVDLRPTTRAAVDELLSGRTIATVAARFHETIVLATSEVIRLVLRARGDLPIVLTGGCFQNVRLVEGLFRKLGDRCVYVHGRVPPNDGGIALGQLVIADAALRKLEIDGGVACALAFPEK